MNYSRLGRVLIPEGGLFDNFDEAFSFVEEQEMEPLQEQIQNLSFSTDDEGLLNILINNKRYFITLTALKDFCKLLKVPAGYINKFPGSGLILENLNNNPYLKNNSDAIKIILWQGNDQEVDKPVIGGVVEGSDPGLGMREYLSILNDEDLFEREATQLDHIAITGEEMVLYFQLPEEIKRDRFSFKGGYSIHYSSNRATDTAFHPFFYLNLVTGSGEVFDFDFEGTRKLRLFKRKKEDFLTKTIENSYAYLGEDLGLFYEEAIKFATVCGNIDTIRFSILKFLKSKALSTYNYSGVKVDGNTVAEEVIPEFKEFAMANRDQLKEMETYAANNLQVDFFLPIFFNRLFTFQPNIENAHFLVRYRKTIGNCLMKILDEVGDIVVDVDTPEN